MRRCAALSLLTLAAALPLRAQSVSADLVGTRSDAPDRTRLTLYVDVPFAGLSFRTASGGLQARYNVSATLFSADRAGRPVGRVTTKAWNRVLSASSQVVARGPSVDRAAQVFEVPPGQYLVRLEVEDEGTRRTTTETVALAARDLSAALALSDVAVLDPSAEASPTPRASAAVGTDEAGVVAFAEAYAASPVRVRVSHELLRGGRTVKGSSTLVTLRAGTTPLQTLVPVSDLDGGAYRLRVRLATEAGALLASSERDVTLVPRGALAAQRSLDAAIAQLRYVARDADVRAIQSGRTPEERAERLREFWRRLDPTPGTPRNERQEEYYARIDAANRRYTGADGGWESDRGSVLVQYGEPERVERRGTATEVWVYPRLNRRFLFVDQGGSRFRLVQPSWDERTRM